MNSWISLFYRGPEQLLPLVVAPVLWLGLAGIGHLIGGRTRTLDVTPFLGWAAISALFTLIGVSIPGTFLILSIIAGVAAVAGIAHAVRTGTPLFVPGSWRVLVLALPLLIIASAMQPSQWDEFSHWLPAPRYLYVINGFPTHDLPFLGAQMLSAYPYGWPFLVMLAARIAGEFLNNVGGQLNVLMLLTFAIFALRTAFALVGRPREGEIGWGFAAAAALLATALNPTFVQKIVLTSYSDISTSVVTAVCVLLAYRLSARLGGHESGTPSAAAYELGLMASLLINLRQPNLVIFVALLLALILVVWRDSRARLAALIRVTPVIILPAFVIYISWRYYVATELAVIPAGEAEILPFTSWNIAAIPQMLSSMGSVVFKKIAYFLPMIIVSVIGLRGLVREGKAFSRLCLITGAIFCAYNMFLVFAYIASFTPNQAVTAVSYWRYNIDVGAMAMVVIAAGALALWQRRASFERYPAWAPTAAIILVLALPLALAPKLRFDLEPPTAFYAKVADDLGHKGFLSARIFVLDPHGTGEAAVITRYYLGTEGEPWMSAFQYRSPESVLSYAAGVPAGAYLLVHSVAPGTEEAVGRSLDARRSYLFKRMADGWEQVMVWDKPANQPS